MLRYAPPRDVVRGGALAAAVLCVSAAVGCSAGPRVAYTPHELRSEVRERIPADRVADVLVPFEPTPAMVARAEKYTDDLTTDFARADRLSRAMSSGEGFDVQWVPVATTTAAETFANGHGNCLSMTSLYVGLARAIGLSAYYVDASDRVNSLSREDELIVDTGHIIATVRTERGWSLVDFTGEVSEYRTFRVIDDLEALAHFYNNRGFETLSIAAQEGKPEGAGQWQKALADFQLATYVHRDFSRAQNNLGVAYARLGNDVAAEQAYTTAVGLDDRFAAPRHNLGNLYLRRGDALAAARWYTLAIRLQRNNPYAHYHLGLALMQADDLDGAVDAFEKAIALDHEYVEPRNLLAQAYRRQGRDEEAARVVAAARRLQ